MSASSNTLNIGAGTTLVLNTHHARFSQQVYVSGTTVATGVVTGVQFPARPTASSSPRRSCCRRHACSRRRTGGRAAVSLGWANFRLQLGQHSYTQVTYEPVLARNRLAAMALEDPKMRAVLWLDDDQYAKDPAVSYSGCSTHGKTSSERPTRGRSARSNGRIARCHGALGSDSASRSRRGDALRR